MPRLSDKMELLQFRHQKPINRLLLDALIENEGHLTKAAKSLNLSKQRFSEWIRLRRLESDLTKIRIRFGWNAPEANLTDELNQVEVKVAGLCKTHNDCALPDVLQPVFHSIAIDYDDNMTYYAIITGHGGVVHKFPLRLSE